MIRKLKEILTMLLEQLIEKKDIKSYLEFRIEFLNLTKHKEIMKLPFENREFINERFRGRTDELKKLLDVITEGKLKEKSKNYYHKIEEMNGDVKE